MPLQQPMMPPEEPRYEQIAKNRLTSFVYEYLQQAGAPKAAEAFKEEVIGRMDHPPPPVKPSEKTFLIDWWVLFWELWSGAPERRESAEMYPSMESKYFHESVVPTMPPAMNGHFGPPMGMDMMGGQPGAFGGRGFPPPRMPTGMPPGGFPMFNPGMPRMPNPASLPMRMGPPGAQFPGGMPRPGVPGAMGDIPGMPRYDFMGPGAQPFPGPSSSGMMPNGGMPHMSLNSPNLGQPPGPDPNMPGSFMGMPPMPPTSSTSMSFGMNDQPMSAGPASGVVPGPGTPGMGGSVPGADPGSVPPPATTSIGSVGTPGSMGQVQMKQEPTSNNGEDIKTEALTPTGAGSGSVGEPGSAPTMGAVSMNGGGPGSAPGSAHSVNNNVNPSTPSGGPMSNPLSNPLSNPMSNPPLSSGPPPGSAEAFKDDSEISKIREGLLDGFKTEVAGGNGGWD
ncbi:hypothetical protein CAEBREN_12237 [Caenorhabditis brenneri]|uniref:Uncharacterized protein n=1 Tax=Caenorhabditis brenneri TaxID=135651 RepID=G0MZ82_CAEBE|nr:hypothetical protein CAEBREN_12237 [Caenorhabditis brenneri]